MKKLKKIIIVIACVVSLSLIGTGIYVSDYYRAVDIEKYMTNGNGVKISEIKEGYLFDGPSEENALIFYPGAKVEETAYAPMLRELAERGVDCFLIKMPFHLAVISPNKAQRITEEYSYKSYYLAGHSLGGAMIADFPARNGNSWAGLFLLAAYPSKALTKADFPIIFIYGENDGVLKRDKLEKGFSLVPDGYEKLIIKGGNHANFASYGKQKGDGEASISGEEQQKITTDIILETIGNQKE